MTNAMTIPRQRCESLFEIPFIVRISLFSPIIYWPSPEARSSVSRW
jgi:hypothetical protein